MAGKAVAALAAVRGEVLPLSDGTPIVLTIHPSYLLRIDDAARKEAEYRQFVADLRTCSATLAGAR